MTVQDYEEFQELGRGIVAYATGKARQRKPIDLWHALQSYEVEDKAQICVLSLIAVVNAAHTCTAFHEYLPITPFRWVHCDSLYDSDAEDRALALLEKISDMIEKQVTLLKGGSEMDNDLVVFMRRAYQREQAERSGS